MPRTQPDLLLQHLGLFVLLLEHAVVGGGQVEQLAPPPPGEQTAHQQAKENERADHDNRDVACRRRALLSQAQLRIEEFAELAARLVEQDFAAVARYLRLIRQVPATQIDGLLRVGVPLRLHGMDPL